MEALLASGATSPGALPTEDDVLLGQMARSGVPLYSWNDRLGPLIERRMLATLEDFRISKGENNSLAYETKLLELRDLLRSYSQAPFTLQRICELILNPRAHNKTLGSLLRSFEILLSVTSTIPTVRPEEVQRLESEYQRVIAMAFPGASVGTELRRTDTVEMDVEAPSAASDV